MNGLSDELFWIEEMLIAQSDNKVWKNEIGWKFLFAYRFIGTECSVLMVLVGQRECTDLDTLLSENPIDCNPERHPDRYYQDNIQPDPMRGQTSRWCSGEVWRLYRHLQS